MAPLTKSAVSVITTITARTAKIVRAAFERWYGLPVVSS